MLALTFFGGSAALDQARRPLVSSRPDFYDYPMGPHLRSYLGIDDASYRGHHRDGRPTSEESAALEAWLQTECRSREALSAEQLVDLLDELVTMDLPRSALVLADSHPGDLFADDFRARLALGVAAMLSADLGSAEDHLRAAQALIPAEPAPYVNLTQIYLEQGELAAAETWCTAGLDAEPNHFALWDLLAEILRDQHGEYLPEQLMAFAEKRCAWAGLALAANLTTTGDRYLKANLLERIYQQGERDHLFLVELTGAYGVAGDFAKIPPLVWQAERLASKGIPWQLHLHCAQAHLALAQKDEALARLAKVGTVQNLPDEARFAISELTEEAQAMTVGMDVDSLH